MKILRIQSDYERLRGFVVPGTGDSAAGILRSDDEYPRPDKLRYQHSLESGDVQSFKDCGLQSEANPLWDFPVCDPYHLWQPNTLHLLNLGILKTMMEWVIGYMDDHGLLD